MAVPTNPYTKTILDLRIDQDLLDIVTAVQHDSHSRFLDVKLWRNSGLTYDLTGINVRVNMRKPDGQYVFNLCEVTDAVNGRFQCELTNQALASVGWLEVQFMLFDYNTEEIILQLNKFRINVLESLFDEKTIESSNEFGAVVALFQDVAYVRDIIEEILQTVRLTNEYLDDLLNSFGAVADIGPILIDIRDHGLKNPPWTDARAGYLDRLNVGGGVGSLKSVQYGAFVNSSATGNYWSTYVVSHSSVIVAKSYIILDSIYNNDSNAASTGTRIVSRTTTSFSISTAYSRTYTWQLIEFY